MGEEAPRGSVNSIDVVVGVVVEDRCGTTVSILLSRIVSS